MADSRPILPVPMDGIGVIHSVSTSLLHLLAGERVQSCVAFWVCQADGSWRAVCPHAIYVEEARRDVD